MFYGFTCECTRVPRPVKAMATGSGVDFRKGQPVNRLQVIVLFTLKRAFCSLEDKLLQFLCIVFFVASLLITHNICYDGFEPHT